MKLTVDFLKAKRACSDGLHWFETNFGSEADYQTVLNRLAKEQFVSWADWVLKAVGPIDEVMEISADTKIDGHLFVAGNLRCTASLQVSLTIKAGGGIEAGGGIKAGEGIEAGGGIEAGWGIEAGGNIEAGWGIKAGGGIKAGEGIEAGEDFGIYCGLRLRLSVKVKYAVVTASTRPNNLVLGEYHEAKKG